jgi:ABC-type multidrug transport system fused ATPase/permease subunit
MFTSIFIQHKWRLIVTYFLFGLEMLGALTRPFFFALAADGLIIGDNTGLYKLIAVHFSYIVVGVIRHRVDTRTYTAIYTSLVTFILNKNLNNQNISKLSAHSTLAREFTDFLEYDLVYVLEACFNLLGSLFFLFHYDKKVAAICITILLPVFMVSYFYGKKVNALTKERNDELEKQIDVIGSLNKSIINGHYKKLRFWQIRISDREAYNFGIMELFVLIVMATSLYITSYFTHTVEIAAGTLIGIYFYVQKFTSGLDTIPYTVQRLSNLKDISKRMQFEEEE